MNSLVNDVYMTESPAAVALLAQIERLADCGLFLQAHELATQLGDYRHWRGPRAMTLAARLVGHLGARRLADVLAYLGYRRYPQAAETRLCYARFLLARRGHYCAWRFVRQFADWLPHTLPRRAEWLSFHAYLYALLRDFSRSAELYAQVQACGVEDHWLLVEQSNCLEQADRYVEALQLCEQVLQNQPQHRAALLQAAQLQLQLSQPEAALARLRKAVSELESSSLCALLVECLIESEQLDEAWHWLEQGEALAPLLEPSLQRWYAARRCDIACLRGEYPQALAYAEAAGGSFYQVIQQRLGSPQGTRRLLPVSFVRQHHMTCVPATLSALANYWGQAVAHLQVAEEICYDGTSHQAERAWAERNGWLVAEFTVDWPTSCALIDRGLPFTLTLQYTGSGHLQAVVGYDEPRGTLLIRDPGQAQFGECLAEPLFDAQRASGPRGLLLLPPAQAHRLEGLNLPERALWDIYYQLVSGLEVHCRDEAVEALEALRSLAPGHRLSLQAQRAIGWYDGHETQVLEATEALLLQYPEDANLILAKAASLVQLQAREVQLDWLAGHCQARWGDPGIVVRYADLLGEDGRLTSQAQLLLERVLRQAPTLAQGWNALANQRWNEGMREEACELYRLAACLNATQEGYSNQYFRALRCLGQSTEGLAFLHARQRQLGHLAAGPGLTLSEFLEELGRLHEVREVLEQAVQQRPEDAALLLNLADFYGRNGELEKNLQMLQRAEPLSRRSTWLRAAVLHSQRSAGDLPQALEWCREAAAMEPLNLSIQRLYVQLLKQSVGEEAADAHIETLAASYPHHCGIAELGVERAQRQSLAMGEQALRRLLSSHPEHAWAIRELAINVARLGRREEALSLCLQARAIAPDNSQGYSTHGFVLLQDGQRDAAREVFCQALRHSVDNDYASGMLLETAASQDEALQSLAFVHGELVRQVTFGDGWLAYQQQAQRLLEGEKLLEQLSEALQNRADLWQLWVVVARQQVLLQRYEQAESVLQGAIERFPLLPRLALEQAQLQKSQGQLSECCATLRDSFRISPLWTSSVRLYVDCLLEQGSGLAEAEQLLRSVLARTPDNSELRAYLAYVLGEQEVYVYAANEAEHVLRDEPSNAWAWNQLRRYSAALNEASRPLALARELVQRRAGDVDAWLALAELETAAAAKEQALREALGYNPRHQAVNEQLLELLLHAGRHEQLQEQLQAPCWAGTPPVELALYGPRARHAEGLLEQADGELRQLLRLHPGSYEAWRLLADWQDAAGEHLDYLDCARQMVRLEPARAMAQGYLGHALLLNQQPHEALPAFSQAYRLDSGYLFAGLNEFDLVLTLGRHQDARALLERLLHGGEQPAVLIRALRWASSYDDQALKRRSLQTLCCHGDTQELWQETLEVLGRAHKDKLLRELLDIGIAAGTLHSAAARFWLQLQDAHWTPNSLWKAFLKALLNDPQHTAKRAMLELLAERQNCMGLLVRTLDSCRAAMQTDALIWGVAAYAMLKHNLHFMMFERLKNWQQRSDLPSWGLDNLAVAMRLQDRDKAAAAVSAVSLERQPDNQDAMLWMLFDAAMAKDHAALEHWLACLQGAELRPFFGSMEHLLRGYRAAVQQGSSSAALGYFESAKALARQAPHSVYKRLRRTLGTDLAFGPLTPRWLGLWRYLQLRF